MFRSFFLAGFECATGINAGGEWIDQIEATHHDHQVAADYRRLRAVGIHGVREGIRWPLVDRGGIYDFATIEPFVEAVCSERMDVIWDLFHYGYPHDLDPFTPVFTERFAAYCAAVAGFIRERCSGTLYFTPVNEPSYFAWAAGEVGRFAPHRRGSGPELKVALARAAIAGIDAIRSVCPDARIVNADPLCHVAAPPGGDAAAVEHFNRVAVFESWDMLSGRLLPELGGSRAHLDIVGINYYWTNQWELGRDEEPLAADDPRRVRLRDLVAEVHRRYGNEILISETSHIDDGRGPWIDEVAADCEALLAAGVPLCGVCLYPVLGMPDWHVRDRWTRMGLWDLVERNGLLRRRPCPDALAALQRAQARDRLRVVDDEDELVGPARA